MSITKKNNYVTFEIMFIHYMLSNRVECPKFGIKKFGIKKVCGFFQIAQNSILNDWILIH